MKTCSRCGGQKSTTEFNKSGRNKDGLHTYCRDCQKAHYRANAARHGANVRRTSAARMERVRELTYGRLKEGCVDCGNQDIRVLEFDHVRGVKVDGVAELIRKGHGLAKIEVEMDKCEVRCKNCHAIVTAERRGASWHDAYTAM